MSGSTTTLVELQAMVAERTRAASTASCSVYRILDADGAVQLADSMLMGLANQYWFRWGPGSDVSGVTAAVLVRSAETSAIGRHMAIALSA